MNQRWNLELCAISLLLCLQLFCSFHLPFFHGSGFASSTCAQSRGTRTLVRRDTSDSITKESKIELGVVCGLSTPAVRLLCCPRNPLTLRHGYLLSFNLPLFYVPGFARTTCAQSRGNTRTLVRRDTSDKYLTPSERTHSYIPNRRAAPHLGLSYLGSRLIIARVICWLSNDTRRFLSPPQQLRYVHQLSKNSSSLVKIKSNICVSSSYDYYGH